MRQSSAATGKSPTRTKSEAKGLLIIEAASELFITQGFDGVSMEAVARAAGVSKQTVYSHYGNKDALFQAAVKRRCLAHQLDGSGMDETRPVADYLRAFGHHVSELLVSDAAIAVHRACIAGAANHSRISQLFWEAGPQQVEAHLSGYLQRQVAAGRLAIDDTPFATQHFLNLLKGEAHFRAILGLPNEQALAELDRYVDSCVRVFMRAYGVGRQTAKAQA